MKILQLCLRVPYPADNGGTIAMYNLTRSLVDQNQEVHLLAINTKKHFVDLTELPREFTEGFKMDAVFVDTSIKPLAAFLNLFSSKSYNIERFISKNFDTKLVEILQNGDFDIVQLESIFVAPYINTIRKYSKAKIVLRSHNVEYRIWERLADSSSSFFKRIYLKMLARRLKKFEVDQVNRYDAVVSITKSDADIYKENGCTKPITIAPVGIDAKKYIVKTEPEFPGVFHLGAMDWLPNIEAVDWLIKEVWPNLISKRPDLKLYLAGRRMPEKYYGTDNVTVVGEVENAKKFIGSKTIMLVPLLSGGGMRVKIVEGMAMGKTIISTSIGAEGIPFSDRNNILIADSPIEFENAIIECISDKSLCMSIGQNGQKLVSEHFDNSIIGKKLVSFYESIVTGNISQTVSINMSDSK